MDPFRSNYPHRFFYSRGHYRVWLWSMFTVTVIVPLLAGATATQH